MGTVVIEPKEHSYLTVDIYAMLPEICTNRSTIFSGKKKVIASFTLMDSTVIATQHLTGGIFRKKTPVIL